MHPVEFTWYKAIVLLTAALALGFGIVNIVYFNKIRLNQNNCQEISSGEALTTLWLNIILVIFAAVLFFWSLFRLIFTGESKKEVVNKKYNTIVHPPIVSPIAKSSLSSSFRSPLTTVSLTPGLPSLPIQIPSIPPSPDTQV